MANNTSATVGSSTSRTGHNVTMKKVLVVDDSAIVREEVAGYLYAHQINVETAFDGKDALEKLKKSGSEFALVIADINMPNIDGFALVEQIRDHAELQSLHVVVLTTECSQEMKERGRRLGISGWIVKPFEGPRIIEPLKKLLH